MKCSWLNGFAFFSLLLLSGNRVQAVILFETFSAYHHIRVVDQSGLRTLSFDSSSETRMSLANPLRGHFEYTEYFHMPRIWNRDLKRVLMAGLGGGSTQRAYQHDYTNVMVDTVELDPAVVDVAKKFFQVKESPSHKIYTEDGRVFLRRTTNKYDAILMDAYTTGRYGSSIPPHLTTRQFFSLTKERLTGNGVLAYNVIGQLQGFRANVVGSLYRTMKEVFPQVYLFPARETQNVVLIATVSPERFDPARVQREGAALARSGIIKLPEFSSRLSSFINTAPPAADQSPILTDEHAPVESLLGRD
jgi:spermidine synthase